MNTDSAELQTNVARRRTFAIISHPDVLEALTATGLHEDFDLNGANIKRGQSLYIFYPGVNLDPARWENPLTLERVEAIRCFVLTEA